MQPKLHHLPASMHARRLSFCLLCLLPACGRQDAAGEQVQQPAALPLVRVEAVGVRQVRREIETTAFLESEHRVEVYSKVAGRVLEVAVDEGAPVKKGQVLALLDAREAEAARRQVEAQLADRRVRLDLAGLEVEAALRRIEQATIEKNRTEAEFQRLSQMDKAYVAPKALDDARSAFATAEKALQIAEFLHRKNVLDVKSSAGAIEEWQSRLAEAELRLHEHEILAPIDGVVASRGIKGGETIGVATELFVVTDLKNLVAYLSRPQRELPSLQQSRDVLFRTDAHPERDFRARIDLVSPVVDPASGSFKLRMRVDPQDASALRPGVFVRARILTESLREALMVPKLAVLAEGERSIVFAVRDGTARKVVLDPGLEERDAIECRNRGDDGLQPGELVIVSGHEDLKDQSRIEVSKG
jgi:multidrug efflux pump subunit AcrA (membrane-fusion protein)